MRDLVLMGIGVLLAVFVDRYVLGTTRKFGQRVDGCPTRLTGKRVRTGSPLSVFHGRPATDKEIAELKERIEALRSEVDAWRASTLTTAERSSPKDLDVSP